jgi:hypothetical protein
VCTATKNLEIPLWEKGWLASVYSFEVWFFSQLNLLVVMPE